MKILSKVLFSVALLVGATTLTFAADTTGKKVLFTEYTSTYNIPMKLTTVNVPITQEIRDWFTKNGVDGTQIGASTASPATKEGIEVLLNERSNDKGVDYQTQTHLAALDLLVRPALQSALDARTADVAEMHIGARVWKLTEITN